MGGNLESLVKVLESTLRFCIRTVKVTNSWRNGIPNLRPRISNLLGSSWVKVMNRYLGNEHEHGLSV